MTPRAFRAPGRVNLIGEHTDYNLGFVLPMAVEFATLVRTTPSRDGLLRIESALYNQQRSVAPAELTTLAPAHDWTDYVFGVARELIHEGFPIRPLEIRIESTVPEGAGLSSSAALEVSSALALLDGRPIDKLRLAQICQRAERNFVGMPSGVMDQYVAVFGEDHAALEIDCRSLTHRVVALPSRLLIIAFNSMVKHTLAQSAYRDRTQECEAAVAAIQMRFPEVRSLRDANEEMLAEVGASMPEKPRRRARHVIGENRRVEEFVAASARKDLRGMGELLVQSHISLRDDYEVSCPELDFLVEAACSIEGVYGARLTGGGFGGCTVNLVDPDVGHAFRGEILRRYRKRFGIEPETYPCRPSSGATEIS